MLNKNRFKIKRFPRERILSVIIIAIAIYLIGYGGWGLFNRYLATHSSNSKIPKLVIKQSTNHPDETNPTKACASYKVAKNHPAKIKIPAIKVTGCIQQVDLDPTGAIATPSNIYLAAWYIKSALPGQPGLSIIDGHISGRYNVDGIFQNLNKLKAEDNFTVTLGDGSKLDYQVMKVQSVPVDKADKILLTQDPNVNSQLNLITCAGRYDKSIKEYDQRVIVSAKLLGQDGDFKRMKN
jgi:LPXTG-site transpeptidase (sortase) family protein